MQVLAATVYAVMMTAIASAASNLDFHLTTGDSGLHATMTADVRDGLQATAIWNGAGLSGHARVSLASTVVNLDKPPGQPLHVGVSGLSIAPAAPAPQPAGDQRLVASTSTVAAAPAAGFLDILAAAGSAVADEIVRWVQLMVPFLLLGLLFILLVPELPRAVRATSMDRPWARLGIGLVILIAMPSASIALLVAGIFLGIWWLGLMMLGLYAVALAAGYTFAGMILGRAVLDRLGGARVHLFWTLLGGLALLSLLALVPYAGAAVGLLAVTYGVGALTLAPRTPPTSAVPAVLTERFRHAAIGRHRELVPSAQGK